MPDQPDIRTPENFCKQLWLEKSVFYSHGSRSRSRASKIEANHARHYPCVLDRRVLDGLVRQSTCNLNSVDESFDSQGFRRLPCVPERVLRHCAGTTCSASRTCSAFGACAFATRAPKAPARARRARAGPHKRCVSKARAATHRSRFEFYFRQRW